MQHPSKEKTLVFIKPDGVQRNLIGEVIGRYERVGLKLIAMKMMMATPELIEKHYTLDPGWRQAVGEKSIKGFTDKGQTPPSTDPLFLAQSIIDRNIRFMTSAPIVVMIWQGAHAVKLVRKLTGSTEPLMSDVGTIRGDYVLDSYEMTSIDDRSLRNLVHASGSVKEAEDEIKHWFTEGEIMEYESAVERILYS